MPRGVVVQAGRTAALVLALIVAFPLAADEAPRRGAVHSWLRAHEVDVLRELAELLAIPNLASDGPNIRRNAEHIVADAGTPRDRRAAPGRRGRPAGRLRRGARRRALGARWSSTPTTTASPSTPRSGRVRPGSRSCATAGSREGGREVPLGRARLAPSSPEWRLYARSAGDDKAPIVGRARRPRCASGRRRQRARSTSSSSSRARRRPARRTSARVPRREQGAAEGRRVAPLRRARAPDAAGPQVFFGVRGRDGRRDHALRPRPRRSTAGTTATGRRTRRWCWPTCVAGPPRHRRAHPDRGLLRRRPAHSPRPSARRSATFPTSTTRCATSWRSPRPRPAARGSSSGSCCPP